MFPAQIRNAAQGWRPKRRWGFSYFFVLRSVKVRQPIAPYYLQRGDTRLAEEKFEPHAKSLLL